MKTLALSKVRVPQDLSRKIAFGTSFYFNLSLDFAPLRT
jgi:hypothetical protein